MNTSHGWTGLNSYWVRNLVGELLYDISAKTAGHSVNLACVWLWTPESMPDQLAKLQDQIFPWAGKLTALRARTYFA